MLCFVLTSPPLMLCVYLQTFEAALFWKKKKKKFDFDFLNVEKTTFCVLRFFYSFTASGGSEESTAGRVVSPCIIMMHRGFRSEEARRARKQR